MSPKAHRIRHHHPLTALFLPLIFILLAPLAGAAATRYVSASKGSDSWPGTSASPWKTIQKAANTALPGDTVIVLAGSYARTSITRSGTASARITYKASGTVTANGFSVRAGYVTIDGFGITSSGRIWNMDSCGVYVKGTRVIVQNNRISQTAYYGIELDPASSYCTVSRNVCIQAALTGINVQGVNHLVEANEVNDVRISMKGNTYNDADGIRVFQSGHVIRGNYVHGITMSANRGAHIDAVHSWTAPANGFYVMKSCVFERNRFILPEASATSGTTGFMIEGAPAGIVIRNNVISAARAVHFLTGSNIRVLNNTLIGKLSWPTGWHPAGIYFEKTSSSIVRGNIVVDFPWAAVFLAGNSGLQIGYNCAWNSNGSTPGGTPQAYDLWKINPKFVTFGSNWKLRIDSPCRDRAWATADVKNDFDGAKRPFGPRPDVGAYEYH